MVLKEASRESHALFFVCCAHAQKKRDLQGLRLNDRERPRLVARNEGLWKAVSDFVRLRTSACHAMQLLIHLGLSHATGPRTSYYHNWLHLSSILCRSPSSLSTVIGKKQLEAVLQRPHVRVLVSLQLETRRDNLDGPGSTWRVLACFEAEVEVARVGRVDAEGVHAALGVGFGVGSEPLLCEALSVLASCVMIEVCAYLCAA